jgi:hypothetical protein
LRLFRSQALRLGLQVAAVTALALRRFPGLGREINHFAGSLAALSTFGTTWAWRANAITPARAALKPLRSCRGLFRLGPFFLSSSLLEPSQYFIQERYLPGFALGFAL